MESFLSPLEAGLDGREEARSADPRTVASRVIPSLRVLVVDDNAHSAESLALIIDLWGYETRIAYNGSQAIELARDFRPEIVLLDIGLPGMDGYTVARVFRGELSLRSTILLAMTGYGREEDQRKAVEAGFDRHLLKPLELDVLENLLAGLAETPR